MGGQSPPKTIVLNLKLIVKPKLEGNGIVIYVNLMLKKLHLLTRAKKLWIILFRPIRLNFVKTKIWLFLCQRLLTYYIPELKKISKKYAMMLSMCVVKKICNIRLLLTIYGITNYCFFFYIQ